MEAVTAHVPIEGSLRRELVEAAVGGDRAAFGALVEPHLAAALGASTVITRSHADGADAVQDALLAAWQGLDRLRDPEAFPAWFRTHVVRAALRVARRRGRVLELQVVDGRAVDGSIEAQLDRRLLGRAFDRLSADDRTLLTLRYLWDVPVAEVAAALGIADGTVKSRTHAAMDRLRAALDAEARR